MGFWQERKQELGGNDVKEELDAAWFFSQLALPGSCSCQELLYDNSNNKNLLNLDSTEFKLRNIYSNQGLVDMS